jgi:hypothetical protein
MPKSEVKSAPKAPAATPTTVPVKTRPADPMTPEVKQKTIEYHKAIIARLENEKVRIEAALKDHKDALKKLA